MALGVTDPFFRSFKLHAPLVCRNERTPSMDAPRPCDTEIPSYASRTFSIKMFHHGIKSKPPYVRPHVRGKVDPSDCFSPNSILRVFESREAIRERERERFLVFTLVILRAISLYSGRTSGKGRGRSWRRSENRRREERNVEYDGAAVKQTGMLQNQYLLDTRRYSTLNASLVTRACTNTRMPLTLCPPLLCDTAEAAVATFRSLHLYTRKTVVSRPETWISFSIIPAR